MPRYKLRTLLILLAVGPMVLAWAWWTAKASYETHRFRAVIFFWLSPVAAFTLGGISCIVQREHPVIRHRKLVQIALLASIGTFVLAWLLSYLWLRRWF